MLSCKTSNIRKKRCSRPTGRGLSSLLNNRGIFCSPQFPHKAINIIPAKQQTLEYFQVGPSGLLRGLSDKSSDVMTSYKVGEAATAVKAGVQNYLT